MFGKRDIFRDVGPELSEAERHRAIRTAGILARQAQQTLTLTARKQYRRYRADAGDRFISWDQWRITTPRPTCLLCSVVSMAKIQTMTIIDDLDGREIDAEEARTVSWTWMGVDYELDVSPTGRRRSRAATASTKAPNGASRSAQIREWAQTNGFDVSPRGRIPAHIVDAFTSNK